MDKKCALIRQTWYEAAKKNLNSNEMLAFFRACMEYEFYDILPTIDDYPFSSVMLMFDMVRENLEQDKIKAENIAMRNRRNGLSGGRPKKITTQETQKKPTETQKTQVDILGNHYTTLHNTTQQKQKKSVSMSPEQIEKETYFSILLYFFANGVIDAPKEAQKFWNYYQARNWRVANGIEIRDRVALAKSWDAKEVDTNLIQVREKYTSLLTSIKCNDPELITKYLSMNIDDESESITIIFKDDNTCPQLLEHKYIKAFAEWMPKCKSSDKMYNLKYLIRP